MRILLTIGAMLATSTMAVAADPKEGHEPVAAAAHVARARALAGSDLAPVADGYLCRAPAAAGDYVKSIVSRPGEVAAKAFDNLYYVGANFVGVWLLVTDDGIVMWDAMNNAADAETIIEPGMRKLGLDPARIRRIIVTHGHYDHFGGAKYFQDKYRPIVMMSAADWAYAYDRDELKTLGLPFVQPPARDAVIEDGQVIDHGGAEIRLFVTPGHTPGTVSSILTVRDGGKPHKVAMWGGTAMPRTSGGIAQFHDSFHKFWGAARAAGITGGISTHPFVDDTLGRFRRMAKGKPNPFMLGRDGAERFMGIHEECILAQMSRYQSWGW